MVSDTFLKTSNIVSPSVTKNDVLNTLKFSLQQSIDVQNFFYKNLQSLKAEINDSNNKIAETAWVEKLGHSIIDKNSNIGLNAVLHQFSEIAEGCMIGASAFFKGESKPFTKYAGVPARELGKNIPR
jgi:acetyltransferase-like isoleucine patch superfamily enzyme